MSKTPIHTPPNTPPGTPRTPQGQGIPRVVPGAPKRRNGGQVQQDAPASPMAHYLAQNVAPAPIPALHHPIFALQHAPQPLIFDDEDESFDTLSTTETVSQGNSFDEEMDNPDLLSDDEIFADGDDILEEEDIALDEEVVYEPQPLARVLNFAPFIAPAQVAPQPITNANPLPFDAAPDPDFATSSRSKRKYDEIEKTPDDEKAPTEQKRKLNTSCNPDELKKTREDNDKDDNDKKGSDQYRWERPRPNLSYMASASQRSNNGPGR